MAIISYRNVMVSLMLVIIPVMYFMHVQLSVSHANKQHSKSVEVQVEDHTTTVSGILSCPANPPNLKGEITFKHFKGTLKQLETEYKKFDPGIGGRFKPAECLDKEKLAVIIPYRDRWLHLLDMLSHLIPFLMRQQIEFTIYVIEQDPPEIFSRGILLNAGFLESLKEDNYTCFIFHDVDMYPINDHNLYRCGKNPRHMAVLLQRYKFRLAYPDYFGGVISYNKEHFLLTNGFSNLYFGWGGEDDDQLARLRSSKLTMLRYPVAYTKYATPFHPADKSNPVNGNRLKLLRDATKRFRYDGVNSVVYNVTKINHGEIYTHINILVEKKTIERETEAKKKEVKLQKY